MTESRGAVTGKRIILEIVQEMREGLHPLLYSRVAPGLYCVYLHPDDFAPIEGLVPRVRAEAQRALTEELRRLNAPAARPQALRWFVDAEVAPPVEPPAAGWEIQIELDRDSEVAPGTFVILSKLTLPALPQFEGGTPTTKVFKTVVSGATRLKTEQVLPPVPSASQPVAPAADDRSRAVLPLPAVVAVGEAASASTQPLVGSASLPSTGRPSERIGRVLAEIAVRDARGPRAFIMDKPDIKIGRGGQYRIVDLQLDAPTRISRVHVRIRRDDRGRFFIKDLSEWGTTVNGERLARGVIREGDEVREIDVESELPPRARIGLADLVFLEFTAATPTHTAPVADAGGVQAASAESAPPVADAPVAAVSAAPVSSTVHDTIDPPRETAS